VGEGKRDASLGEATLSSAGHRIEGLERWRGRSLAEKQSRRPKFLIALEKKRAR
jgi:hypothetical protein